MSQADRRIRGGIRRRDERSLSVRFWRRSSSHPSLIPATTGGCHDRGICLLSHYARRRSLGGEGIGRTKRASERASAGRQFASFMRLIQVGTGGSRCLLIFELELMSVCVECKVPDQASYDMRILKLFGLDVGQLKRVGERRGGACSRFGCRFWTWGLLRTTHGTLLLVLRPRVNEVTERRPFGNEFHRLAGEWIDSTYLERLWRRRRSWHER